MKSIGFTMRYWLVIPSGFFVGILFGLYVGHQYNRLMPIMYMNEHSVVWPQKIPEKPEARANPPSETKHIRIVCMIMTMPKNHEKRATAVNNTWAPRCDAYYFLSSVEDKSLHAVVAVPEEGRDKLWHKTKFGVNYAMEHYPDYDFFYKADDDTYTVMENMRVLLKDHDPEIPIIMGRRWKPFVHQGYLSGGGGYVMSRAALKLIVKGLKNDSKCAGNEDGGAEDVRLGKCAEVVGVRLIDSLDEKGLERFHPFNAFGMINDVSGENPSWYKSYNYHKILTGYKCCSPKSVTFHYVSPGDMYLYEYFLYKLRPASLQ